MRMILILFVLPSCITSAGAQYLLPKQSKLAENGTRVIRVSKTALRIENREGKIENANRDSLLQEFGVQYPITFFLSDQGRLDSVYTYPTDQGFYKKHEFVYAPEGYITQIGVVDAQGKLESRSLLELVGDSMWRITSWQNETLKGESWANLDSIVFKKWYYWSNEPTDQKYLVSTFDLDKNEKSDLIYHGDELIKEERFQWVVENDVPTTFRYTLYEKENKTRKPARKTYVFPIDSQGQAVNKQTGTIFDPFRMHNYYERIERSKMKGMSNGFDHLFLLDALVESMEHSELWTFDGTSVVYLYEFIYE